jgi:hypothetical protein
MLARGAEDKEHAMSQNLNSAIAVIGIDIGKNSFHVVGQDQRGAIVLRQKWLRSQVQARLVNLPPCLIGMEACVGAHHLSRKLQALGHDARLMPAKYVRPYSKRQKNDFRDAEAIAEAVQRPSMKFVATKTAEQLDLQALHRVRLARIGAETNFDRRSHNPRQHIKARQSLSTPLVRSGGLGGVGQGRAKALGAPWAKILDRGSQKAPASAQLLRRFVPIADLSRCSNAYAYSITWSASSKNESEILRPIALAVLRLTTSS